MQVIIIGVQKAKCIVLIHVIETMGHGSREEKNRLLLVLS